MTPIKKDYLLLKTKIFFGVFLLLTGLSSLSIFLDFNQEIISKIIPSLSLITFVLLLLSFIFSLRLFKSIVLELSNNKFQLQAIDNSLSTIEFSTDGIILNANSNFLNLMGYTLEEVQGKHHRIFVDTEFGKSSEYENFWKNLKSNQVQTAEFKRLGKNRIEVWIQASYTPVMNHSGEIVRIIKYAQDITTEKVLSLEMKKSMKEVTTVLQNMSEGDLTIEIIDDYSDEFDLLKNSMNQTLGKLKEAMSDVRIKSNELVNYANGLNEIADNLNKTAMEQASSMDDISSSLEELSSTIAMNAENAKNTDIISQKVLVEARKGSDSVLDTATAMKDIVSQVSIIKEISEQTNLLSLNASIEAARAGESGQGFAVVASEVKKLSDKSNQSANQVSKLAIDSVKISNKALNEITNIIPSIDKTAKLMEEITNTTNEQENNIKLIINKAVNRLDSTAQENAIVSDELARSAKDLAARANSLNKTIDFFKIA